MADVVLIPIGRIPLSVNNQDLAGCEKIDGDFTAPTTFHAGPGFTDYTKGREQGTLTLTFALFAQKQEFEEAIRNVPEVNGARRFSMTFRLGTQTWLCKRCQAPTVRFSGDEIAGNASLTHTVVVAERVSLSS